jgi:predicted methyltransferase
VMALHDLYVIPKRYNGEEYVRVGNPANMDYFLEQVYKGLKPGGRFVVVDHAGDPDSDNETVADLHRIIESFARQEIEARGFRFVASTDALRNPADSRANIVFDEEIQGRTDRFVLVFEK